MARRPEECRKKVAGMGTMATTRVTTMHMMAIAVMRTIAVTVTTKAIKVMKTTKHIGKRIKNMSLAAVLIVAAALFGIGLFGALSQQSFVMLMMGLELMLNGSLLAAMGFWSIALEGAPKGQLLAIIIMAVMAVELALGFALVVAVYRKREADTTEGLGTMAR